MSKRKSTVYTKLDRLKVAGDRKVINVIGLVVTSVPFPGAIQSGYEVMLVDESNAEVNCSIFLSKSSDMPHPPCLGDILCVRKAGLEEKEGSQIAIQAHNWILLRKEEDFKSSADFPDYSLGPTERNRVSQLKTWCRKQGDGGDKPQQQQASSHARPKVTKSRSNLPSSSTNLPPTTMPSSLHTSKLNLADGSSALRKALLSLSPAIRVSRPTKNRYFNTQLAGIANQVVGRKEAAIAGILKYFKPPSSSKGNDYFTVLGVIDDSRPSSGSANISCVLFNPDKHKLPVVCSPGEVIMLKGLTINTFQGCLQGMGHETCLVGVFPVDPAIPIPYTIGDWYEMKSSEITRIQQLKDWAQKEMPLVLNSKLEELTCANYCLTLCLVVEVCLDPQGPVILTVSDGTLPKSPLAERSRSLTPVSCDPALQHTFQGLTSTVKVTTAIKPKVTAGDVVKLTNICMIKSEQASSSNASMELMIQDHPYYQGCVNVLPANSDVATEFKSRLIISDSLQPSNTISSSLPNMFTKMTCTEGREHTTLDKLLKAPVGSVHIAVVQVTGLGSSVCNKLEDVCHLRCSGCMTRYVTPNSQTADYNQLITAGDICPFCYSDDILEPKLLGFMYAFSLLVTDHTAQVEVIASGSEGEKFFSGVKLPPTNLYVNLRAKQQFLNVLKSLTDSSDPFSCNPSVNQSRPSLELCISVFSSSTGQRRYKVIDTILCDPNP